MPTKTSSTDKPTICNSELKDPTWRSRWRIRKAHLLLLLLGGVGGLLLLHLLATSLQNMTFAPNTCSGLIHTADYTQMVKLQPEKQEMVAVQTVDKLDDGHPAVLVQVTTHDQRNALDVYIFGCTIQQRKPQLIQLFAQRGLVQGTAEITPKETLVTSALDTNINPERAVLLQPDQQNVYHEYTWQQGNFVQLPFPGFYPVTSQYEAEAFQQSANKEQSLPWHDPVLTATQMSKDLLQWRDDLQPRLISQTQTAAVVEITERDPRVVLHVTLKRLIQTDNTGLWFVTDASTGGTILTSPGTINQPFQTSVTSPIRFSGVSALIDGQTTATLFDHTLTPVEGASGIPVTVRSDSTYMGMLAYSGLTGGQEGVLLVKSLPKTKNYGKEAGQVLLTKVILD